VLKEQQQKVLVRIIILKIILIIIVGMAKYPILTQVVNPVADQNEVAIPIELNKEMRSPLIY